MIRFNCSSCGKAIKVSDTAKGKDGKCPACGAAVHVPEATVTSEQEMPPLLPESLYEQDFVPSSLPHDADILTTRKSVVPPKLQRSTKVSQLFSSLRVPKVSLRNAAIFGGAGLTCIVLLAVMLSVFSGRTAVERGELVDANDATGNDVEQPGVVIAERDPSKDATDLTGLVDEQEGFAIAERTEPEERAKATPLVELDVINRAAMLHEHGLSKEARYELIQLIFAADAGDSEKAQAYSLLGTISFESNEIHLALRTWRILVQTYPHSESAKAVEGRLDELSTIVGESLRESVDDALALSYLRHGDFWSRGKSQAFLIDSSWISNLEAAVKWYDKVIREFPGTTAARIAYEEKLRTFLGWEDSGRFGAKHGVLENPARYIPILIKTFEAFERDFPQATSLQAFRFQLAQVHWKNKQWDGTRHWLQVIIKASGQQDSFYADLAKRRLQHVEH